MCHSFNKCYLNQCFFMIHRRLHNNIKYRHCSLQILLFSFWYRVNKRKSWSSLSRDALKWIKLKEMMNLNIEVVVLVKAQLWCTEREFCKQLACYCALMWLRTGWIYPNSSWFSSSLALRQYWIAWQTWVNESLVSAEPGHYSHNNITTQQNIP